MLWWDHSANLGSDTIQGGHRDGEPCGNHTPLSRYFPPSWRPRGSRHLSGRQTVRSPDQSSWNDDGRINRKWDSIFGILWRHWRAADGHGRGNLGLPLPLWIGNSCQYRQPARARRPDSSFSRRSGADSPSTALRRRPAEPPHVPETASEIDRPSGSCRAFISGSSENTPTGTWQRYSLDSFHCPVSRLASPVRPGRPRRPAPEAAPRPGARASPKRAAGRTGAVAHFAPKAGESGNPRRPGWAEGRGGGKELAKDQAWN